MEGIPVTYINTAGETQNKFNNTFYWDIQIGLTKCSFFPRIKKTTMAQTAIIWTSK